MPIAGIDLEKIDERSDLFEFTAGKLLSAPSFKDLKVSLDPLALKVSAEAYFFMSVAYKEKRIPSGSKTMPAKVAAMTALAVGTVQPIRPPSLNVNEEEYLFVNGALALKLACALQDHPFNQRPFDDRLRWYRMVQELSFPSLAPLLNEANASKNKLVTVFEPSLTIDELAKIDSVVGAFSLMAEKSNT